VCFVCIVRSTLIAPNQDAARVVSVQLARPASLRWQVPALCGTIGFQPVGILQVRPNCLKSPPAARRKVNQRIDLRLKSARTLQMSASSAKQQLL
jgi:hypothetical protein